MYHVTFKDGAITKIHTHESEQMLIATTNSPEHTPLQDVGRGFVILIEKSRDSQHIMIQNLILVNRFF